MKDTKTIGDRFLKEFYADIENFDKKQNLENIVTLRNTINEVINDYRYDDAVGFLHNFLGKKVCLNHLQNDRTATGYLDKYEKQHYCVTLYVFTEEGSSKWQMSLNEAIETQLEIKLC